MKKIARKPQKPQSNIVPFPNSDEAIIRDVTGPNAQLVRMPGGWAIYRSDGVLFGYLIRPDMTEEV